MNGESDTGPVRSVVARLAERAAPLCERLLDREWPASSEGLPPAPSAAVDDYLRKWRRVVADDDDTLFARRLAWDGLTGAGVRRLLEDGGRGSLTPSGWVESLAEALEFAARGSDPLGTAPGHERAPLPFEDLLAPLVAWARHAVRRDLDRSARRLAAPLEITARAWSGLESALLQQLSDVAAPTLYAEFDRRRPAGRTLLARWLADLPPAGERSTACYRAFVMEARGHGLLPLLERYPVLARLLGCSLEAWCESTVELIERLRTDLPLVRNHFGWAELPRAIVEIQGALSDPHHRGRVVTALTFETGERIIYKPRSLQMDVAYGQLLAWCNRTAALHAGPAGPVTLFAVRTLDRGRYGWTEFVDHRPCHDIAGVERFYVGAGALLCVLHLLGATDAHCENIVAHGDQLVLIDAETVMQPQMRTAVDADVDVEARAWDTVVRTGLLPQWDFSADGLRAVDTSGLGSFDQLQGDDAAPRWDAVNTDDMVPAVGRWSPASRGNLPVLDGVPALPTEHVDHLVHGFEQMYRFVLSRRDVLLEVAAAATAAAGTGSGLATRELDPPPLAAFARAKSRFIARATQHYTALTRRAIQPAELASGIDRGIVLDDLCRPFLSFPDPPDLWPIRQSEWRALERLDVPYFQVATTAATLHGDDGPPVPIALLLPAFDEVSARLRAWSEPELRHQVALIRGVFLARATAPASAGTDAESLADAGTPATVADDRGPLIEAAIRLAEELESTALRRQDGSAHWLTLIHRSEADRYQLERVGDDLYDGAAGIALFLATLDAVTGQPRYPDLIRAALQPLRKTLQSSSAAQRLARRIGIGGASGLGSLIYALVRIGDRLDGPPMLDDAERAAAQIGDDEIRGDRWFDLVGGSGGAILGLLTLYHRTGRPCLIEKAIRCGDHLLRHRCGEPGRRVWKTFAERPLTGMAHGAAGMALALLRLHQASGEARFREAAREAVAYERSVFDAAARNWPDYRPAANADGAPGHSVMWCHGAPGIGLARLAVMSLDNDGEYLDEVEAALDTTMAFGLRGPDYLCCGNLGRADLLVEAGLSLGRPGLGSQAAVAAASIAARAEREGGFRVVHDRPARSFKPGFFRGVSGIGYQLLRIACPDRVPSVLSWQ